MILKRNRMKFMLRLIRLMNLKNRLLFRRVRKLNMRLLGRNRLLRMRFPLLLISVLLRLKLVL